MILDINGLSALADGDVAVAPILQQAAQLAIPVIVLGEYRYGIGQSRHRARYEKWLTEVVSSCRVLDIDEGTAAHYADIREELKQRAHPIPTNDLWIAALVRQHAFPLLSRDRHFDFVPGLRRVGW